MAVKDVTTRVVLETVERVNGTDLRLKDELVRLTGQPVKVIFRALERDDRAGYLDYGMWLWGSWLTELGKMHLAGLRATDAKGKES